MAPLLSSHIHISIIKKILGRYIRYVVLVVLPWCFITKRDRSCTTELELKSEDERIFESGQL